MTTLKRANHHWWPEAVSQHWAGRDGKVGRLQPHESFQRLPPSQLGAIGNGHHVKVGRLPGDTTPWDFSFESEFDVVDSNFPAVISWLQSLESVSLEGDLSDRFVPTSTVSERLRVLTECVVSLAVRSPMNRAVIAKFPDSLGLPPMNKAERNAVVGMNMRGSLRLISDDIKANAKFAVLFSPKHEFVFGDGFFHNLTFVRNRPLAPKICAPITPNICVVVYRPMQYMVEPRLSTIVLSEGEVEACNHAVQVYSRQEIFFRDCQPKLVDAFTRNEHLQYASDENPIDTLIRAIPGVCCP